MPIPDRWKQACLFYVGLPDLISHGKKVFDTPASEKGVLVSRDVAQRLIEADQLWRELPAQLEPEAFISAVLDSCFDGKLLREHMRNASDNAKAIQKATTILEKALKRKDNNLIVGLDKLLEKTNFINSLQEVGKYLEQNKRYGFTLEAGESINGYTSREYSLSYRQCTPHVDFVRELAENLVGCGIKYEKMRGLLSQTVAVVFPEAPVYDNDLLDKTLKPAGSRKKPADPDPVS